MSVTFKVVFSIFDKIRKGEIFCEWEKTTLKSLCLLKHTYTYSQLNWNDLTFFFSARILLSISGIESSGFKDSVEFKDVEEFVTILSLFIWGRIDSIDSFASLESSLDEASLFQSLPFSIAACYKSSKTHSTFRTQRWKIHEIIKIKDNDYDSINNLLLMIHTRAQLNVVKELSKTLEIVESHSMIAIAETFISH